MHGTGDTERLPVPHSPNGHGSPSGRPRFAASANPTTGPRHQLVPTPDAASISAARHRSRLRETLKWLLSIGILVILAPPLLAVSLLGAIYWQARTDQMRPVDAIVVLGAAQYDGRPSPVLQARLDHALALYKAGYAPLIVVTGGREPGDRFTEAETGREYLAGHGVPVGAILLENTGRDSWQSMQGMAALLRPRHLTRVLLVSDGFHLFRLKKMAHDLGLTAYASADRNSPIRPNSRTELTYAVREAGALAAYMWETK